MKHTVIAIIEIEAPADFLKDARPGMIEECIHRNLNNHIEPACEGGDVIEVRVALPVRPIPSL